VWGASQPDETALPKVVSYIEGMPKPSTKKQSRKRITDESQFAKAVIDIIIEETEAEPKVTPPKNLVAVAAGRLGGLKGGKARAAKLTPKKRKAIAKKAAQARWSKEKRKD
jgi:hypothetical protein